MSSPSIAIIGCGLAGLSLSLLLSNHHIPTTIYEARPASSEYVGKTSWVLAPNALRVLHHASASLYARTVNTGFAHDGVDFVNMKGEKFGRMVLGGEERYGFPAVRMWRESARRELLREAEARGVEIRFGMKCMGVEEVEKAHRDDGEAAKNGSGKVLMKFEDGEVLEADVVIGADGINSRVRPFVDPNAKVEFHGQLAVGSFAPLRNLSPESRQLAVNPHFILGEGGSFAIMPASGLEEDESIFVFSTLETTDRSHKEWRELEADKGLLQLMLREKAQGREWPGVVGELVREAEVGMYIMAPFRYVVNYTRFSSQTGRVILLGDAAHAFPPSVGQGGAMALEDAETLGLVLAAAFSQTSPRTSPAFSEENPKASTSDLKQLLSTWETHRKARIEKVVARTKAGSHVRRATKDADAQARKEEGMKKGAGSVVGGRKEEDLGWLYGYDARNWELKS